jgi:hypothetical protein
LSDVNGGAENGIGRILIPLQIAGIQQIYARRPIGRHKPSLRPRSAVEVVIDGIGTLRNTFVEDK